MADRNESSIQPFDPFREFDLLRTRPGGWPALPRLFAQFEDVPATSAPSVDITEDDGKYVVTAELPGAKKEDITVEFENDVLTIRGEKRSEREEKDEHRRFVERTYGSFARSFSLPGNADPDRVEASIEDGVLTIEIAKRQEAKPKTVAVR